MGSGSEDVGWPLLPFREKVGMRGLLGSRLMDDVSSREDSRALTFFLFLSQRKMGQTAK